MPYLPRALVVLGLLLAAACGTRTSLDDFAGGGGGRDSGGRDSGGRDGGLVDSGGRDSGGFDAGGFDAGSGCRGDEDCSDGVFCNGSERCMPGGRCMPGRPPCDESGPCGRAVCEERMGACVPVIPDRDGDGFTDERCAGLDCDDEDPDVFPGAPELCDGMRDYDCNGRAGCEDPSCIPDISLRCPCFFAPEIDPRCLCTDVLPPFRMVEEVCSDMIDDDCNDLVDCDDPFCDGTMGCMGGSCVYDGDLGSMTGFAVTRGTTMPGEPNDFTGSCTTTLAPERAFLWRAPSDGTYIIGTGGSTYDTVLYVLDGDCRGPEVACDDDMGVGMTSRVAIRAMAGDTFVIVVDGWSMSTGTFVLNIVTM